MSYQKIAQKIQDELSNELGFTFSSGLAPNKVIAKIASKWNKPNGLTVISGRDIHEFLENVQHIANQWAPINARKNLFKTSLIFTLPKPLSDQIEQYQTLNGAGALNDCINSCMKSGGAPTSIKVVSPFFNLNSQNDKRDEVTAQLCKRMARGTSRTLTFCLPTLSSNDSGAIRLAAPKSLFYTAKRRVDTVKIEMLPQTDPDKNIRPWHAKMLWLESNQYTALMMGSSNFTSPAMGLNSDNNAEANLLYITPKKAYAMNIGLLAQCWPEAKQINDAEKIEWTGIAYPLGEENTEEITSLPAGFIAAYFIAGGSQQLRLNFLPAKLPDTWHLSAGLRYATIVFDSEKFNQLQGPLQVTIPWHGIETPGKLLVEWQGKQAFWPVNVENQQDLPLAPEIKSMTAHDLICILSAYDYSMAFRAWARQQADNLADEEIDSAIPAALDPLKRFRIQETFLHRIRSRARMLAGIKKNLERPAWAEKTLRWRLEGIIGIKSLAQKLMAELEQNTPKASETVLEIADFFIMLSEVNYQDCPGALSRLQFDSIYQAFLRDILENAHIKISTKKRELPQEVREFWGRIHDRCLQ